MQQFLCLLDEDSKRNEQGNVDCSHRESCFVLLPSPLLIAEFNFIAYFCQLLRNFGYHEGVVQIAIKRKLRWSRRLYVAASKRCFLAHCWSALETNQMFLATDQTVISLQRCQIRWTALSNTRVSSMQTRGNDSPAIRLIWKNATCGRRAIRLLLNNLEGVYLASEVLPHWVVTLDIDWKEFYDCKFASWKSGNLTRTSNVGHSRCSPTMLRNFYCVCFAYVIIQLLQADWSKACGSGWL